MKFRILQSTGTGPGPLLMLALFGTVAIVHCNSSQSSQMAPSTRTSSEMERSMLLRNKRGIGDFLMRFWKGNKKPNHAHHNHNYQAQQSQSMPTYSQEFPFGQGSEMSFPMIQYPGGQFISPGPQFHNFQQSPHHHHHHQKQPQSDQSDQGNFGYAGFNSQQFAQQMAAQQQQQPQYNFNQQQGQGQGQQQYQPTNQDNNYQPNENNGGQQGQSQQPYGQHQQDGGMQGEESYNQPISYRPGPMMQHQAASQYAPVSMAQANTFAAKPYGPHPSAIDVHQVLDQFIRSAGLSPSGDHESVKGSDRSFAESHTKPVFTLKKLYSYPFYFTAAGEKQPGYNLRRNSNDELLINAALKKNLLASQKMDSSEPLRASASSSSQSMIPLNGKSDDESIIRQNDGGDEMIDEDESLFIAKNAAALQEFLSSNQQHHLQQQQNDKSDNKISGAKSE